MRKRSIESRAGCESGTRKTSSSGKLFLGRVAVEAEQHSPKPVCDELPEMVDHSQK